VRVIAARPRAHLSDRCCGRDRRQRGWNDPGRRGGAARAAPVLDTADPRRHLAIEAMAMYAGESVACVNTVLPASHLVYSLAEGVSRSTRAAAPASPAPRERPRNTRPGSCVPVTPHDNRNTKPIGVNGGSR
jgi:hypothetical protein